VAGGVRDLSPGQAGKLLVQVGLVALDGEDPVRAAFGEVGDVVALAMHGVGGDHRVTQVADLVEQRLEAGDFVGLAVEVGAGQDHCGVLIAGTSATHSAIAAYERCPATTAHTAAVTTATKGCRIPRRARGSGSSASAAGNPPAVSGTLRAGAPGPWGQSLVRPRARSAR
jgi:hypothetical protein